MHQTSLLKNDIELLNSLDEPSNENINIITQMLSSRKAIKQIWTHLNDHLKACPEIHIAFIKHIYVNSFNSIQNFLQNDAGLSSEKFFILLKQYNPEFFEYCIKLNKIPKDIKIQAIVEKPELAKYLTVEDPIKEIIDLQPEIVPYLSSKIPHTIEVLGENGIDKTSFWNDNNQAIQYFELPNGINLTGRNDYIKLVHAYLLENTSIHEFCNRYMINDSSAFAKVLFRVQEEDSSLDEQITEVKTSAQKKYVVFMQNLIANIVSGKSTIEQSIETIPTINAYSFLDAKSFLDETTYNQLMGQMASEIGLSKSSSSKRIPDKYNVEFPTIGNLSIETLIEWFSYEGSKNPIHDVSIALKKLTGICKYNSEIKIQPDFITSKLQSVASSFEEKINPSVLLHNISFVDKNNQVIHPTEENIQDAIDYLEATDRYLCQKNMKCVLKAIIQNTLKKDDISQAESEKTLKSAQEKAAWLTRVKKVKSANTIDDYISNIANFRTEANITSPSPKDELETFYHDVETTDNLYTTKEAGKSTLNANPQTVQHISHISLDEDLRQYPKENEEDDGYPNYGKE